MSAPAGLGIDLAGKIAFRVDGEEGGEWSVDLAGAVRDGVDGTEEALVEIASAEVFGRLAVGTLDVESAVLGGRIRLHGDRRALTKLSLALNPPGGRARI